MSSKIKGILKTLLIIILIVLVIIGGYFIINNTKFIENFKKNFLGIQDDLYIELKDENFKNEVERAKLYHYTQLDDNAKAIYITLENNIDNFKAGKDEIALPTKLGEMMKTEQEQADLQQSFQDAWDAFSKDKPELFYFDGNKFCLITKITQSIGGQKYDLFIGKGKNVNYFVDDFASEQEVDLAIKQYNNRTSEIAKLISTQSSEYTNSYEKIIKVHDWLVDNLQYDSQMQNLNNGNAYGGLVQKQAVCEGYAEAFKCMMDKLEVPCITVCGISKDASVGKEEKHAWNYVYIGEKWYAIDVTWDDPIINTVGNVTNNNNLKYKYFLKGEKTMQQDHMATGEIVDGGKCFEYPKLSENDFEK